MLDPTHCHTLCFLSASATHTHCHNIPREAARSESQISRPRLSGGRGTVTWLQSILGKEEARTEGRP